MIARREFLMGSLASAGCLFAKGHIGSANVSAISDEIATSPDGAIAFAKQYGMRWLELRNVPGEKSKPYFYMDRVELKPHAQTFADNGIRISFLNTSLLKFGLPGTEPLSRKKETPEAREKRIAREQAMFERRNEDLRKCIKAAQVLGCDKVRIFAFSRTEDPMSVIPRVAEIFEPMCKIAEGEGIKLLVENESSCNVGTCAESAAILKLIHSKAFGMNWDALNGFSLHEEPYPGGYTLLPKNRIWNVQIKGKSILDTPEHLDWSSMIAALDRDGYRGQFGLETHYFDGTNIEKSHLSMKEILRVVGTE